jgi:ABC-type polar amino acid transport system ATPase subunit
MNDCLAMIKINSPVILRIINNIGEHRRTVIQKYEKYSTARILVTHTHTHTHTHAHTYIYISTHIGAARFINQTKEFFKNPADPRIGKTSNGQ